MSALTDFVQTVRTWINEDEETFPDAVGIDCVRMLEHRVNTELRHRDNTYRVRAPLTDQCVNLPGNWQELIYVRYPGGLPLGYLSNDEYWRTRAAGRYPPILGVTNAEFDPDPLDPTGGVLEVTQADIVGRTRTPTHRLGFTIVGSTLFVHPNVDPDAGTEIELCYYGSIPPLDASTDFFVKHYKLYLLGTLAATAMFNIDDERVPQWDSQTTAILQAMGTASKVAETSGATPRIRQRGFG